MCFKGISYGRYINKCPTDAKGYDFFNVKRWLLSRVQWFITKSSTCFGANINAQYSDVFHCLRLPTFPSRVLTSMVLNSFPIQFIHPIR